MRALYNKITIRNDIMGYPHIELDYKINNENIYVTICVKIYLKIHNMQELHEILQY
jgi:hypothetical protein